MVKPECIKGNYHEEMESGIGKADSTERSAVQGTPHTAAGEDYFPNRLLCDPVRDKVNTRTSLSMR